MRGEGPAEPVNYQLITNGRILLVFVGAWELLAVVPGKADVMPLPHVDQELGDWMVALLR